MAITGIAAVIGIKRIQGWRAGALIFSSYFLAE